MLCGLAVARTTLIALKNCNEEPHDKTELAVISSKYKARPRVTSIQVGEETINYKSTVQNLGVIFDQTMSFNDQISKICKSSPITI